MRYTTYAELKAVMDHERWLKKMKEYREKENTKKDNEKKENKFSDFSYEEEHKRIQELNRIYLEKIRNGEM